MNEVTPPQPNPAILQAYDTFMSQTTPDRLLKILARYELFRLAAQSSRSPRAAKFRTGCEKS